MVIKAIVGGETRRVRGDIDLRDAQGVPGTRTRNLVRLFPACHVDTTCSTIYKGTSIRSVD